MNIWLVNPFDPLPGEAEQLGRYARLAGALQRRGHQVVWWSSDYSHRFKRMVNCARVTEAAQEWGISIVLVHTLPYEQNISWRRVRSHQIFARSFYEQASGRDAPDLIMASSPPLETARTVTLMAANWSIPSVIDIQDQWPDTFLRAFPRSMRPLARLLLGHWYILERDAYRNADAITGVAKGYLDRGLSVGGSKAQAGVFPLGVDLHVFENKLSKSPSGAPCRRNVGEGLPKFIYSGSLSHSYDVHTILDAVLLLRRTSGLRFEVLISGAGESESDLRKFADKHGLSNVRFLGFLEFEDWLSELVQCDIGFNAAHSDALIYMPNKLFYYLGAGLAVLNTIPGECAELIASHECGFSYAAGDAAACATAITNLIRSPNMLRNMRASSRRLALSLFDRTVISRDLVKFLENVALTTR